MLIFLLIIIKIPRGQGNSKHAVNLHVSRPQSSTEMPAYPSPLSTETNGTPVDTGSLSHLEMAALIHHFLLPASS